MTRLILLAILLLSLPAISQAQKNDTLVRYFDARLEPCKKKDFVFIGVIIRDPFGWDGIIYDDSARTIMRGHYRDEACKEKDGWFMYYFANGKRALSGKYENNVRQLTWKSWYPAGQLKDSVQFLNGVQEGIGFSFFENGQLESSGLYRQGVLDQDWTFYHENGKIATKEKYAAGKLSALECFDTSGSSTGVNCAIKRDPEIKGRYGGVIKFLKDSLVYPPIAKANNLEGYVIVEFTITKDGSLKDIRILSSPDQLFNDEVLRVLKSVPGWYPAISHNRMLNFTYTLNIPFFVDDPEIHIEEKGDLRLNELEFPRD